MRPDIDRAGAECPQLREQLLTILHISVIRLVVAEKSPDRSHLPAYAGCVNADRHREACRVGACSSLRLTHGSTRRTIDSDKNRRQNEPANQSQLTRSMDDLSSHAQVPSLRLDFIPKVRPAFRDRPPEPRDLQLCPRSVYQYDPLEQAFMYEEHPWTAT